MAAKSAGVGRIALLLALCSCCAGELRAAEHVTLVNGFDMICDHRETIGDVTRLYVGRDETNFVEVKTGEIAAIDDAVPAPRIEVPAKSAPKPVQKQTLTAAELHELLAAAGAERNLDVDLLSCLVRAESGGRANAVSRTGARGLMQLMPGTAAELGVADSFEPGQNVSGGSAYLNALLIHYHDNLALALAAYNAGPKAVDRYHGVPPYRETRAYVARIIHEFNQRKDTERAIARRAHPADKALRANSGMTPARTQSD